MTSSQNILTLIHEVAILFPVFLIIFSFRGFFMSWICSLLGDETARDEGFFSLNPFVHMDVVNLALFVGIIYFTGGLLGDFIPRAFLFLLLISVGNRWAFNIPITESAFKFPKFGNIVSSYSSSLSFLVLAFMNLVLIKFLSFEIFPRYVSVSIMELIRTLFDTAIFFAAINVIPIPPLDSAKILYTILPESSHELIDKMYEYNFIIIFAIYIVPGISHIFWHLVSILQITFKTSLVRILF